MIDKFKLEVINSDFELHKKLLDLIFLLDDIYETHKQTQLVERELYSNAILSQNIYITLLEEEKQLKKHQKLNFKELERLTNKIDNIDVLNFFIDNKEPTEEDYQIFILDKCF